MKKLLWISMCAPIPKSPHAGGQTFQYYFNNMIKTGDWEITLISKVLDSEINLEKTIESNGTNIYIYKSKGIRRLFDIAISIPTKINFKSRFGNTLLYATYLEYRKQLVKLSKSGYKPDVVIFEWGQMLPLIKYVKKLFPYAKLVASEHDVMFLGYFRNSEAEKNPIKHFIKKERYQSIKKNELSNLNICDLVFTHNTKDLKLLKNENVNCELDWLVPKYSVRANNRITPTNSVVFFGDMSRYENYISAIWFIDNVMPLLSDHDVKFLVIGNKPNQELINKAGVNVEVLGFVEDLDSIFSSCLCMVAPLLLGAGVKVKVIEAMASGVPVITNDIGIEGIPAVSGKDYINCDTADEYAEAIISLLNNSGLGEDISISGKRCIDNSFNLRASFINYNSHIKSELDKSKL